MQCFPFKNFRVIFFQNICGGFCFVLFFPVGNAEVNVKYSHGLGTVGTHQCRLPHENFKVCYSNLALEKQFSPNVFWLPHKHQNIIFWFPWTSAETGIRGKAGIPIRHQHGPCLCRIWSASSVFLCQLQLVYFSSCTVFCATAIDFSLFFFFFPCESHVAQILAVKEFPLIAQQCNESRMRAEPLDAFLAWSLWGCCGEGSPCWARSWLYLPRKAPLLSQSERQFQIVKSSWKQERGTLIHPDCAGPSIHNKMMSATWT